MWHHRIRSVIFQFSSIAEQNKGPSSNRSNVGFAMFVDQIVTIECHGRFRGYMHLYHNVRDQFLVFNKKIHITLHLSNFLVEINLKSDASMTKWTTVWYYMY